MSLFSYLLADLVLEDLDLLLFPHGPDPPLMNHNLYLSSLQSGAIDLYFIIDYFQPKPLNLKPIQAVGVSQ